MNVYVGVNPRTEKKGTLESVPGSSFLWVDRDKDMPTKPDGTLDWRYDIPPPTITVQSSPGKYQMYWALTEFCTDKSLIQDLNRKLAYILDGDAVFDMPRIMRMPGFPNMKYPDKPVAKLVEYDPDREYNVQQYDVLLMWLTDEIMRRRPDSAPAPARVRPDGTRVRTPDEDIVAAFRRVYGDGERRVPSGIPRLVGFLRSRGVAEVQAINYLDGWADAHFKDWDRGNWESYVQIQIIPMYRQYPGTISDWWTPERAFQWLEWLDGYVQAPEAAVQAFMPVAVASGARVSDEPPAFPEGWEQRVPADVDDLPEYDDTPGEAVEVESWLPDQEVQELLNDIVAEGIRERRQKMSLTDTNVIAKAEQFGDTSVKWSKVAAKCKMCGRYYRKYRCGEADMLHPGQHPLNPIRCHFFLCPFCYEREALIHRDRNKEWYGRLRYPGVFMTVIDGIPEIAMSDARVAINRFHDRARRRLQSQGYIYGGIRATKIFNSPKGEGLYGIACMYVLDVQGKGPSQDELKKAEKEALEGVELPEGASGSLKSEDVAESVTTGRNTPTGIGGKRQFDTLSGMEFLKVRAEGLKLFIQGFPKFVDEGFSGKGVRTVVPLGKGVKGVQGSITGCANLSPQAALDWFYLANTYPVSPTEPGGIPSLEATWIAYDLLNNKHRIQGFGNLRQVEERVKGAKEPNSCGLCFSTDVEPQDFR